MDDRSFRAYYNTLGLTFLFLFLVFLFLFPSSSFLFYLPLPYRGRVATRRVQYNTGLQEKAP